MARAGSVIEWCTMYVNSRNITCLTLHWFDHSKRFLFQHQENSAGITTFCWPTYYYQIYCAEKHETRKKFVETISSKIRFSMKIQIYDSEKMLMEVWITVEYESHIRHSVDSLGSVWLIKNINTVYSLLLMQHTVIDLLDETTVKYSRKEHKILIKKLKIIATSYWSFNSIKTEINVLVNFGNTLPIEQTCRSAIIAFLTTEKNTWKSLISEWCTHSGSRALLPWEQAMFIV